MRLGSVVREVYNVTESGGKIIEKYYRYDEWISVGKNKYTRKDSHSFLIFLLKDPNFFRMEYKISGFWMRVIYFSDEEAYILF